MYRLLEDHEEEYIQGIFLENLSKFDEKEIVGKIFKDNRCEIISTKTVEELSHFLSQVFNKKLQIKIVGSAKLGFSLKTLILNQNFRFFDITSDIDIAIISDELYDDFWSDTYKEFCKNYFWRDRNSFEKFFFRGWVRPDMLPQKLQRRNFWFDTMTEIRRDIFDDELKITAGLYKSTDFLMGYQTHCINQCKINWMAKNDK